MPSIPYLLMQELSDLEREAKNTDQYGRAQALYSCVSMVNNLMHGRPVEEVFSRCRDTFTEGIANPDGVYEQDEVEAFQDAVLVLDVLTEQFNVQVSS